MRCLILLCLFCGNWNRLSAAEPAVLPERDFAGWPEGWSEAYRGFEEYIAVRRTYWPAAALTILEDGAVVHNLQQAATRSTRQGLLLYRDGQEQLELGADEDPRNQQPNIFAVGERLAPEPGIYMAGIRASTAQGYQHIFPWTWIEIAWPSPAKNLQQSLIIRTIAPPGRDEDFWPNERLFLYRDYCIFPRKYNPFDMNFGNRRVDPPIILKLHQDGRMTRALLGGEVEHLLVWRIYRDGRLVDQRSASGSAEWPVRYGWGDYRVFLGVEGPHGFMPVSNLLEFSLFPSKAGQVEVTADENRNEIPDQLEKYATGVGELLEEVRNALHASPQRRRPQPAR